MNDFVDLSSPLRFWRSLNRQGTKIFSTSRLIGGIHPKRLLEMMDAARGAEDVPKEPCAFEIQQFFENSPITGTLSLETQRAPLSYLIDEIN